uniref:HTH_Tnp_Tc3_1 domain-containing protein n=1 Tax=Caenorhabditis japonica TaxID=281687 RepID=A0A8R1EB99_CAEJA
MGCAPKLTRREQAQLDVFMDSGISLYQISQCLNSSRNVIMRYLANPIPYGTRPSSGRPRKLTEQDERRVVKYLSKQEKSVNHSLGELQLGVCRQTVLNIIRRSGVFIRQTKMKTPSMTDHHKRSRKNGFSLL